RDDVTAAADLVYEVYYSSSANIGSVSDIKANGTKAGQVTGTTSYQIIGLTIDKDYYFNIIVKDTKGNEDGYTMRMPFCDGTGVSGDEYEICDPGSLQWAGLHLSKDFVITKNIDLATSKNWNASKGFLPIGSSLSPFTGDLDGQSF